MGHIYIQLYIYNYIYVYTVYMYLFEYVLGIGASYDMHIRVCCILLALVVQCLLCNNMTLESRNFYTIETETAFDSLHDRCQRLKKIV